MLVNLSVPKQDIVVPFFAEQVLNNRLWSLPTGDFAIFLGHHANIEVVGHHPIHLQGSKHVQ